VGQLAFQLTHWHILPIGHNKYNIFNVFLVQDNKIYLTHLLT